MKINENLPYVLKDLYSYDIPACHYNILKHLGYDVTGIDPDNKAERNVAIGKIMKNNPRLTSILMNTTKSIIDLYLTKNSITEKHLVIRQYDGVILTKPMKHLDIGEVGLEFRNYLDIFITSIEKKKFLAKDNTRSRVFIKGVPSRYEAMDEFYRRLCNINFSDRTVIFKSLQKIKDEIMNTRDAQIFAIPTREDRFNVYLKEYGEVEIGRSLINMMDTSDIDRERYYEFYLAPFTRSIVFQYVR
jgi:hypothetical protein